MVGAADEFLDLQLEDAKDEVSRTRQALLDMGISEDDIVSGGKVLEKKIGSSHTDAYLAYKTALSYKAFVMKRRLYRLCRRQSLCWRSAYPIWIKTAFC